MFTKIREGWHNAFYRLTMLYIAVLVTLIFILQVYRFFYDLPSDSVRSGKGDDKSYASLIPLIGVVLDEES